MKNDFRRVPLIVILACVLVALGFAHAEASTQVSVTYTADNIVAGFYQDGSAPVSLALGGNATNWQVADTAVLDLLSGHDYQLIFRVKNLPGTSNGNPGGFLAQITGGVEGGPIYTSALWEVAIDADPGGDAPTDFNPLPWIAATEYGNNGGANIWTNVHGGPVAGISTSAQWIWDDTNFAFLEHPDLWVRATFRSAVPEPASTLIWGFLGAMGLCWLRRRRRA